MFNLFASLLKYFSRGFGFERRWRDSIGATIATVSIAKKGKQTVDTTIVLRYRCNKTADKRQVNRTHVKYLFLFFFFEILFLP
jgi:hypothetical protein